MVGSDFYQLLLNSSGAALVTGLFVWYLKSRDKNDQERENRFNSVIQDYLRDSIQVKQDLAKKLQRNADVLESVEKTIVAQNKIMVDKIDGKYFPKRRLAKN